MDCSYCVASKIFNWPSIFPEFQTIKKLRPHWRHFSHSTSACVTLEPKVPWRRWLPSPVTYSFPLFMSFSHESEHTNLLQNSPYWSSTYCFKFSTHWKIKMESLIDWQINHKSQNDLVSSSSRLSHGALTGQFQMPDCFWSLWFSVPQCANQPTPITQNSLF